MADQNDFGVPKIKEERAILGRKVYYVFFGDRYDTQEEAEAVRNAEIQRLQAIENEKILINQLHQNYDNDPEYLTAWVISAPSRDERNVWWGLLGQKDTGLAAFVDVRGLSEAIYEQTRDLALRGYSIVSIAPVNSGVAGYTFPGGNKVGGAGWGYSYTQGVVILAKRINT